MKWRFSTLVLTIGLLSGCSEETVVAEAATQTPGLGIGGAATQDLGGIANIEVGGEMIAGFSWIRCYASTTPRPGLIAEGTFQGEKLRIVAEIIGPGSQGTVQIDMRREVWRLHQGRVEATSDGKTFSGFGTLKGQGTAAPKNGIAKFVPIIDGEDVKPFHFTIECK